MMVRQFTVAMVANEKGKGFASTAVGFYHLGMLELMTAEIFRSTSIMYISRSLPLDPPLSKQVSTAGLPP